MKKIMLSLAMALVSVCASAQVYIGGTAGISSNKFKGGDSKTAYALIPEIGYEFNNKWEAGLEIGIKKGEVCELKAVPEATTFIVAPYVRYTAVETKLVNLFVEGTIGYGSVSKENGGDYYEAGIKPGLAVKLSDHVNFITKVGFLGYKGYSPNHGDNSSTFGLNVDASNISFGAIYKF